MMRLCLSVFLRTLLLFIVWGKLSVMLPSPVSTACHYNPNRNFLFIHNFGTSLWPNFRNLTSLKMSSQSFLRIQGNHTIYPQDKGLRSSDFSRLALQLLSCRSWVDLHKLVVFCEHQSSNVTLLAFPTWLRGGWLFFKIPVAQLRSGCNFCQEFPEKLKITETQLRRQLTTATRDQKWPLSSWVACDQGQLNSLYFHKKL